MQRGDRPQNRKAHEEVSDFTRDALLNVIESLAGNTLCGVNDRVNLSRMAKAQQCTLSAEFSVRSNARRVTPIEER